MKKLSLVFLNGEGKKATFKPSHAKENLSADAVKDVMTDIADLHLFEKNGVEQYVTPKSAHYTETIITELF